MAAMFRTPGGRVLTVFVIAIVLILIFHNEQSAGTALLPFLPVLPSQQPSKATPEREAWLQERVALSEKSWQKSVTLRDQMAAKHPDNPKIPFFPTDFMKYPFTIWDFFPATWTCPHDMQRVGRLGDGGKWVCGMSIYESIPAPKRLPENVETRGEGEQRSSSEEAAAAQQGLVIYSFGINAESSFEAEMLDRLPAARIWGYDFSVPGWGPQIAAQYRSRTFFQKVGLGKKDEHDASPPFWTLPALMQKNKHSYIDILKIDIEGSEYDALDTLMDAFEHTHGASGTGVLPIGQVMIELHLGDGVHLDRKGAGTDVDFGRFRGWWERLEKMGMRPAWMEMNLFAVTLGSKKSDPRCTEYVWVNARDERSVLWKV